jgi:catechol 2,3-dioxygenase-like lactoylglutathione lyase family enzyme
LDQGANKLRNSEGYKPHVIPNALKVISGYKDNRNVEVDEKMQIEEINLVEKLEDITGVTCIYVPVSDVNKAIQWYETNLGCKHVKGQNIEPDMTSAILRFPEQNGNFLEPSLRQTVPAMFLVQSRQWTGQYGFTKAGDGGNHPPIGCFITPRLQEMYSRFKENGVDIVSDIPENRPCGPNFLFRDLDGNLWEIWQA